MMKTIFKKILASTALCLAAVVSQSCQSCSAEVPTERYVRQMPYSPIRDAELEQSSREQLAALQSLASSCKSVRVVIKWSLFPGRILQGTEVPLTESEKAELLSLIGKIQPVKPDLCACVTPAYALELQFVMADGSIKTTPFPRVAALSRVSSDGYAFMCSMALPDADAERLVKLAKHEWVQQRFFSVCITGKRKQMFKCEKARRVLLVDNAKLNMAVLLVLAVFCHALLWVEKDCAGTHAWESICLAFFAVPAWCVAFLYRAHSLENWRRDMVVFGLLLGYEALLICWHAPLLWGEHDRWYWHTGLMHPRWVEPSVVWGWLPVHVCMLGLALVGVRTLYRLKKNKL